MTVSVAHLFTFQLSNSFRLMEPERPLQDSSELETGSDDQRHPDLFSEVSFQPEGFTAFSTMSVASIELSSTFARRDRQFE